ncbi:putative sphingoid long-chain base transporter RSB1 [Apodospora peruviana]|uniref:Sphingoid long-chain base transporter RSB1 n=1 Tax=Apodospora peruviana TaxID=516989 RepID=A0AAE0HZH3_9PEZI|nr:putative sphingoid long-chain base transporter RSB1 [Apodospora peruviana]
MPSATRLPTYAELHLPKRPDGKPDYSLCTGDEQAAKLCGPYTESLFLYRIWLAPNALFIAVFLLSLIHFAVIWFWTKRRGTSFFVSMTLGLLTEVIGYIGRVMGWQNQWNNGAFLMQICCLTIGPAFLAAGIYFCLSRIVNVYGRENSRIPPEWLPKIFIPCDVVSLILQAAGGAIASINSSKNPSATNTGKNIMVAGLAFQIVVLVAFFAVVVDLGFRIYRRHGTLGSYAAFDQNPQLVALRHSNYFRGFLAALVLSAVAIFWRSCYRVAELKDGFTGEMMKHQGQFVAFEGCMIVFAVVVLNVFHPALVFGALIDGELKGNGTSVGRKGAEKLMSQSGGESDYEEVPNPRAAQPYDSYEFRDMRVQQHEAGRPV